MIVLLNTLWMICVIVMTAFPLAIIFGQLRIINMAHGEFITIGAYSVVVTNLFGMPFVVAPVIAVLSAGIIGFVTERLIIWRFYSRPFDSLLATWGISLLLREVIELIFGKQYRNVPAPITGSTDIFGAIYPDGRLLVMGIVVVFAVIFFWWYNRSSHAKLVKAMVDNPDLARACGVNTSRLATVVFVGGCGMASLSGVLLASYIRVDPTLGLDYLVMSFITLVIGGLGSFTGLVFGGGVAGTVNSVSSWLIDQTSGYVILLMLAVFILWRRPRGLSGK